MRSVLVLWKNNMNLMAFKSFSKFIILVLAPVLVSIAMVKFIPITNGLTIGVIDNSKTVSSEHIIDVMKENPHIKIKNIEDDMLTTEFANSRVAAVVRFDKDFEKDIINGEEASVKITGKEEDSTHEIIENTITPYIQNLEDIGLAVEGDKKEFENLISEYQKDNLVIGMKNIGDEKQNYDQVKIIVGFLIMIMMYKGLTGAERVNVDKRTGIFSRVILSGVSTFKYYLGNVLASLTILIIQIVATLGLIKAILKMDIGMEYTELFFILLLVVIFAVSLGTVCVAVTSKSETANIMGNIVIIVSLMIGGAFMPVEFFPDFAGKISKLTPVRWITDMVANIQQGSTLTAEWQSIVLILCFSTVMFLVAGFVTNQKDKKFVES